MLSVIRRTSAPRHFIHHVVIVIQENRSFDNLFHGFPEADYADSGSLRDGRKVALEPVSLKVDFDLSNGSRPAIATSTVMRY